MRHLFMIDRAYVESCDPSLSFARHLSRRLGMDLSDFYTGLETGCFVTGQGSGRSATAESVRAVLEALGGRSGKLGKRHAMEKEASLLGLRLSQLVQLAAVEERDQGPVYTEVSADPADIGYYTTGLDAAYLVLVHLSGRVKWTNYLREGEDPLGWNPTLERLGRFSAAAGISLSETAGYVKPETYLVRTRIGRDERVAMTSLLAKEGLFSIYGTRSARKIARKAGIENFERVQQQLIERRSSEMTVISLLEYLRPFGMTLPGFFKLIE